MSLINKELTEKNGYVIEFSIDKDVYAKAELEAYKKNVKNMNVPGFRKGKAPMHVIKTFYGKEVFFEDAINACIPEAFEAAITEAGYDIVGNPKFDLVSMEGDIVLKAEGFVKPEVTIENYKGIEATKKEVVITDEQIDAEIDKARDRNARFVQESEEAIKDGDTVTLDFEGFVDGVAFEGGKGENYELKIGSGSFIPGFEAQIVGHKIGEDFDVNVTFPEDYSAKDLAGKASTFKCTVKSLKQLPEVDDEFVKDVSEFNTVDEYKADVKAKLQADAEKAEDAKVDEQLMNVVCENIVGEIPEVMYENEAENCVRDYENRLRYQGMSLDMFMKYTGQTIETLKTQFRPQAEKQVKGRLALEYIAKVENLTASEEDINTEYQKIADAYNLEIEKVKASIDSAAIAADVVVGKAALFLRENAAISTAEEEAK